jgi:hypothetical protein
MHALLAASAVCETDRAAMTCARCHDTHWTCEEHPDKPMGHDGCKGAGDPCPDCNPQSADKVPTLPPGFKIERT